MILNLKRYISLLLVLMLLIGIVPKAYAAELPTNSTIPEETVSETVETTAPTIPTDPTDPTEPTGPPDETNEPTTETESAGNPNEVALVWRRTSSNYYDTLVDDAHVFTYGIELTKLFSDGQGNFDKVEFILFNETDGYYAIAELNGDEGIYYITGHTGNPENATRFIPIKGEDGKGKVFVKGVEDDIWIATELRTDDGYTLLKDDIKIVISQVETADTCDIYTSDVLGLVQNDPRYATIINDTGDLRNMPQKHLEHHHLTASSTVDGNDVTMLEDSGSKNAHAPLSVVNTKGFDLPATGDHGVWMYGLAGILLMAGSITSIIIGCRKKSNKK